MKYVMLTLLSLAILISAKAQAGAEGHGADEISRLLNEAKNVTIPDLFARVDERDAILEASPTVKKKYMAIRDEMILKLSATKLEPVKYEPLDSTTGLSTWIATTTRPGSKIYYNPDAKIYKKHVFKVPDRWTVIEHFLHEIGHQYGLNEDEAWSFAQVLLRDYRASLSHAPKSEECRTDGCVMRKNAEFSAVQNWLHENDDCETLVSWIMSINRLKDSKFEVTCGDTESVGVILLKVDDAEWGGPAPKVRRIN